MLPMINKKENNIKIDYSSLSKFYLDRWADIFYLLEERYGGKRMVFLKDTKFLQLIAQSIYFLNLYNNCIIKKLEIVSKSNNKNEKINEKIKKYITYIKYNNDLLSSKIKKFFFRETPNIHINDIFYRPDLTVYNTGNEIINFLDNYREKDEELKNLLSKFFFYLSLVYGFIYDSWDNTGIFLKFSPNKLIFDYISNKIKNELNNINTEGERIEESIRAFAHKILPLVLMAYLEKAGVNDELYRWFESYQFRNIYRIFVKFFYDYYEKVDIEPFTYRLVDIIRYIDGMIQDSDEFIENDERKRTNKEIFESIKNNISGLIELYKASYEKKELKNYRSFYDREIEIIDKLHKKLEFSHSFREINEKFYKLENLVENNIVINIETKSIDKEEIENELMNVIEVIRKREKNEGENNLKLVYLIEKLDREQLFTMLSGYVSMMKKYYLANAILTGFYKPGVFLAQFTSIIRTNLLKGPILMFKSIPFVSMYPRVRDIDGNIMRAIIFDESIKTGYTYSLFDAHLQNLFGREVETITYPLFNFVTYEKVVASNVESLCIVKNLYDYPHEYIADISVSPLFNPIEIKKIDIEIVSGEEEKRDILNKIIDVVKYKKEGEHRIDLTLILTNTKATLFIAKLFANKIKESYKGKKVFIFSPSSEGQVIALWTAFLLKLQDIDVYLNIDTIKKNNIKEENLFKVAIDISLDTGFTLAYRWCMENNKPFKVEDIKDKISWFDLILTLVKRDEGKKLTLDRQII